MRSILFFTLLSCTAFGQDLLKLSEEDLFKKFQNSIAYKTTYEHLSINEQKERFKDYACLIKKYKYDFSKDSNFLTEEELIKVTEEDDNKLQGTNYNNVELADTFFLLMNRNYESRWSFYDNHKKCLNEDEYKW